MCSAVALYISSVHTTEWHCSYLECSAAIKNECMEYMLPSGGLHVPQASVQCSNQVYCVVYPEDIHA